MLLFSYILAASLEGALVVTMYRQEMDVYVWAFGFLLLASLLSIPLENSQIADQVKDEMAESGVNVDWYDMWSNYTRCVIYGLVLGRIVSPFYGMVAAYAVACLFLVLALMKMMPPQE